MDKPDPTQIKKSRIAINSLSSIATRILSLVFLLWFHRHLLKSIDTEEYSLLPLVLGGFAAAQTILELMGGGIARYVTEAAALHDKQRIQAITSSMLPVMWGTTVVFLAVSGIAIWKLDWFVEVEDVYRGQMQLMVALFAIALAYEFVTYPYQVGLQAHQEYVKINLILLAQEILRTLVLLVLLVAVSVKVHWVVVANVLGMIFASTLRMVYSRRTLPELRRVPGGGDWQTVREILSFSGWSSLGSLAEMLKKSAPVLLLNRLGSADGLSAYHLGSLAFRHMQRMMSQLSGPLQPVLTILHARKDDELVRKIYLRGGRYFLWISLGATMLLVSLGAPLIELYIPEKNKLLAPLVTLVMWLLVCTFPFIYASVMLYRVVVAKADIRGFFLLALFAQVLSVGSMYVLLVEYDMDVRGVAWAMLGSVAVTHVFGFWPMGLKKAGVSLSEFCQQTLLLGFAPAVVSLGVAYGIHGRFDTTTLVGIVWQGALLVGVYFLVFFACLRPEDRHDLGTFLETARRRALALTGR